MANSSGLGAGTDIYVCPQCKGKLVAADQSLQCALCHAAYNVRGGIPNFILEDLTQSANPVFRQARLIDRLAPIYESKLWYQLVLNIFAGYRRTTLPQLINAIVELVGPVRGPILDVACGPGTYGRHVASPARKVYGIDISRGMLEQGLAYSLREGVTNICFARAKVEALPFGNAVFDAALCCGSLHLFPDTVGALREISRTMKPGAPLVVLTFTAGDTGILRFRWFRERYRRSGRPRIFEIPALEQNLRQAGFENYRPSVNGSLLIFSAQRRWQPCIDEGDGR